MWLFQAFGQISRIYLDWLDDGMDNVEMPVILCWNIGSSKGIMKHYVLTFTPKTHVLSFCDAFLGFNRFATKNSIYAETMNQDGSAW